jgi:hypothetical protein
LLGHKLNSLLSTNFAKRALCAGAVADFSPDILADIGAQVGMHTVGMHTIWSAPTKA